MKRLIYGLLVLLLILPSLACGGEETGDGPVNQQAVDQALQNAGDQADEPAANGDEPVVEENGEDMPAEGGDEAIDEGAMDDGADEAADDAADDAGEGKGE